MDGNGQNSGRDGGRPLAADDGAAPSHRTDVAQRADQDRCHFVKKAKNHSGFRPRWWSY